jgi:hypothetical protein
MSNEYPEGSIKNIERENRLKRIKEAKDLDKKWSKKVVEANRENEFQKKQQEEYIGAIEQFKTINQMIEELKRNREDYIKRQEESEIEKEKEKQMKYENMIREQEKKKQFDLFIKQKGIEASNYIKNKKEEEDRKYEELHRCEKKKQTKYEENIKTKKVIDNFLIKKEKEINEEKRNVLNPSTMDVLYTITNPFHNNGNKIDYSTTRFHNITIERHDNNLKEEINLKINAYDKAKIEAENTKKIINEKNNRLKEFKKKEKINYREQINKNRAKENLEKLNNEIQQFNKMKKGDKTNVKKRIDINANVNNAKHNEKKAEHMMNKLLENQKGNRGKIYGENRLQIVTNKKNENEQKISDDSLNNFYKDKNDTYEINEEYIENQFEEINDKDNKKNKNKKEIKKYEEPIIRDKIPKNEVINRLSPVDLPSYQKVELENVNEFEHKEPKVKNQIFILNKKEKNVNKYYLEDIPSKVNDFNLLNELQLNNNNYNSNYTNNEMNDVKLFINQMNSNNSKINYENNNLNLKDINSDLVQNKEDNKYQNINNNDIMNNNKINEEKKKKDENKDKKWKYNKQELYERKKRMLKDKSNFK